MRGTPGRSGRGSHARRLATALPALALLAASLAACGEEAPTGSTGSTDAGSTSPPDTETTAATAVPLTVPSEARLSTIEGIDYPKGLALTDGAAWALLNRQDDLGARQWIEVVGVDATTREVTGRVEIETVAGDFLGAAITSGAGAVWVVTSRCNADTPSLLYRVDPADLAVSAPVDLGDGASCDGLQVAAGSGKVWAGGFRRDPATAFAREVDAATLAVGAARELPPPPPYGGLVRVMYADEAVWVSTEVGTVVHSAGDWAEVLRLDGEVRTVVEHEGAVWAGLEDGLHRYEGDPPAEVSHLPLPDLRPGQARGVQVLAAGGAGLWAEVLHPTGRTEVRQIDTAIAGFGPNVLGDHMWLLGVGDDGLWLNGPLGDIGLHYGMPSPVGAIIGPDAVYDVGSPQATVVDGESRVWLITSTYDVEEALLHRVGGEPPEIDLDVDLGEDVPVALAADGDRLWVVTTVRASLPLTETHVPLALVPVDPASGEVGERRDLGVSMNARWSPPRPLAAAHGSLWLVLPPEEGETETLLRIDPDTARVTARITLPTTGASLAMDSELWVIDTVMVRSVDPDANRAVDRLPLEQYVERAYPTGGSLWVLRRDLNAPPDTPVEMRRVDPATGETVGTYELPSASGGAVAATGDFAWSGGDRVALVDLATGEVRSISPSPNYHWSPFAADEDGAWFVGLSRGGPVGLARALLPTDLVGSG